MMPGVQNKIDVTFSQSKSAFTLTVYLVEKNTVGQLVEKIRKRGSISKEATLSKMRAVAQDTDIMLGPETLTLKDPVSMMRVTLHCKSRYCQHTACFDATTFLTLNEQTPTWTCPICNRSIATDDDLFLDEYFYDILENTTKAVESVILHPDGTWVNKDIDTDHPNAKSLNNNNYNTSCPSVKEKDRKLLFGARKAEIVSLDDDNEDIGAPTSSSLRFVQSRNTSISVGPSPLPTPSRKRGTAQFVDLTLGGDEDYTPPVHAPPDPPPTKRIRVDPPRNTHLSTSETNRVNLSLHSVLHGVSPTSTVRESHIRSPPSSVSPRYKGITVFRFNERPATLNSQSRTSRPIQPQQQDYTPYQVTTANTTQRSPYFQRFRTNGSPTVNHMDYLRSFQNGWEDSSNP